LLRILNENTITLQIKKIKEVGVIMNRERREGKTLKEEILEYLRTKIILRELKPGDRIVELDIAKKFDISRGPVREAVRRLEDEGLLEYKKNIGCIVKVLSEKELREMYLILSNLERLSIDLTNGVIKKEYLNKMQKLADDVKKYVEERDIESIINTDYEIHKQIVLNTENEKLYTLWNSMKSNYYAMYLTVVNKDEGIIERIPKKHQRLVDVLSEENLEKSIEEIKNHYENSYKLIL